MGHIWLYMGHIWTYMVHIWPCMVHIWSYMAHICPYMDHIWPQARTHKSIGPQYRCVPPLFVHDYGCPLCVHFMDVLLPSVHSPRMKLNQDMIICGHMWPYMVHIQTYIPIYGNIWTIYVHIWAMYGHIWSMYGHIWAIDYYLLLPWPSQIGFTCLYPAQPYMNHPAPDIEP